MATAQDVLNAVAEAKESKSWKDATAMLKELGGLGMYSSHARATKVSDDLAYVIVHGKIKHGKALTDRYQFTHMDTGKPPFWYKVFGGKADHALMKKMQAEVKEREARP